MSNKRDYLNLKEVQDLFELERFLKFTKDDLSSVTDLDETEENQEMFEAEDFFDRIIEHGRSNEKSSPLFVEEVDKLLQRHLPLVLRSLINCSQEFSAYETYSKWLEFVQKEKGLSRLIEVITNGGSELINLAGNFKSEPEIAFYTFDTSLKMLHVLENPSDDQIKDVESFILENGTPCLMQYASISPNGLNEDQVVPVPVADDTIQITYDSYIERVVNTYQTTLSILGNISEAKKLRSFILKTYNELWEPLERAQLGYEETDNEGNCKSKIYKNDTANICSFTVSSLDSLNRKLSSKQFTKDTFDFLPYILENLAEKDSERASEVFAHAVFLLEEGDAKNEFIEVYGTRCVRDLLHDNYIEQAAELLSELGDTLSAKENQILVLKDPRNQNNEGLPLVAMVNFKTDEKPDKENRDFFLIFQEEIIYLTRDNSLSGAKRFVALDENNKATARYIEPIRLLLEEISNYSVDLDFKSHGEHLRIGSNKYSIEG